MSEKPVLSKKHIYLLIAINAVIVVLFLLSWILLMFKKTEASFLTSVGLTNLKYYTVLSNILEVIASIMLIIFLFRLLKGRINTIPHLLFFVKYTGTVTVSVTFLVVVTMLWPLTHYPDLFTGSNLWLHLVIPILSILEFLFLDRLGTISFRETFLTVIPAVIYAFFYLLNLMINGIGGPPHANDFYGLLTWGLPVGLALFAAILLINWGAACLLRLGNMKFGSRK